VTELETSTTDSALAARVRELEARLVGEEILAARLASEKAKLAEVTAERDRLRRAYTLLLEQHELLRRRLFVAKAERIDATQLELEFAATKAKLDALAKQLGMELEGPPWPPPASWSPPAPQTGGQAPPSGGPPKAGSKKPSPTGRRNLREEDIKDETRIELTDPTLDDTWKCIGFEESCRYGYRRGGPVRIVLARAKYKKVVDAEEGTEDEEPVVELMTVKKPKELVERGLLAPSLIAHMLVSKYRFGIPFHRLAEMLRAQGVRLDDGTMCRYAEDVGATLGCIVDAMVKEAKETAFCLSTDATGVCIQPEPLASGRRQACRKGHFFVVLADQDHVFFEFQREHTSKAVCDMFRGFSRYIQADAHAIYNAVFRGEARVSDDDAAPTEVGCLAHCRRRFWEAATVTKDAAAREGLLRLRAIFKLEEEWAALPPKQRHDLRQRYARPLVDDFFAWAEGEFPRVKNVRGLVASAFGYAVRQKDALRRFLDDGRLAATNNHSERALRSPICAGRKAWLFFGSDDHATAAANLFSLIVSCQLHGLDPETYLAEIIHILPLWPRDRYLELAPKYWAATRARLDPDEIARELGPLTVPPRPSAQQQPTSE
jgi:transposase